MRRLLGGGALAVTLCAAAPARADKMSETLDISLGARVAWLDIHRELGVPFSEEPIDVLMESQPHLVRSGPLSGGLLRMGLSLDGLRVGVGLGLVGGYKMGFKHRPFRDGITAEVGGLWGANVEGWVGYAFFDHDDVRPFIDIRGAFTALQTTVAISDQELGRLGESHLTALLGSLEIRAGLRLPMSDWLFAEVGVGISPLPSDIGPERGSVFVNLGLPIPTANAF